MSGSSSFWRLGRVRLRDGYRGLVKSSHQRSQSTSIKCVLVRKAPTTLKENTDDAEGKHSKAVRDEPNKTQGRTSPPGSGVTAAIPLPLDKEVVIVKGCCILCGGCYLVVGGGNSARRDRDANNSRPASAPKTSQLDVDVFYHSGTTVYKRPSKGVDEQQPWSSVRISDLSRNFHASCPKQRTSECLE